MTLSTIVREHDEATILEVHGKLIHGESCSRMRDALESLAAHPHLIVDCKGLTHIDSSGLGVLVSAHAAAVRRGGSIKLLHIARHVHDILIFTKLHTVFEVFEDEAAALRSMQPSLAGVADSTLSRGVTR